MAENRPLFAHPRLIAVALLGVLALITSAALYLRPLSGDMRPASAQMKAVNVSAVLGVRG